MLCHLLIPCLRSGFVELFRQIIFLTFIINPELKKVFSLIFNVIAFYLPKWKLISEKLQK